MFYLSGALVGVGFFVGLVVGLTGMGGGILMTPLLVFGLGLPPSAAVGTDLAYGAVTKLAGAWQHWRQETADLPTVRDLALGSLPASALAVGLLAWLGGRDAALAEVVLARALGLALSLAGGLLLWRLFVEPATTSAKPARRRRGAVTAIGALGGFLVGLTSVGSGSVIMALLVFAVPLSPRKLVGTDIVHAALLVGLSALGHAGLGHVNWTVAFPLTLGSIPGVLLGSRATVYVPQRPLQAGLALLLVLSGLRLLR